MAWPLREEFFCGFPKSPIKVHVLLFVALLKYFYNYNVSFNLNIILGAKIFSTELVLNKDLSVTGSTGGRNLDAAYADTVFVDAAATLAALITFKAVKDELKEIIYIYICNSKILYRRGQDTGDIPDREKFLLFLKILKDSLVLCMFLARVNS